MNALRRIFRRDDTIDLNRDALDLEETRRLGTRDTASAYEAITAVKAEQQRLRRLRKILETRASRLTPGKILETRASRLTPGKIRRDLRFTGGQYGEMALERASQPGGEKAMYETQLEAIEQREQAVHDLWIDLERFVRS